MQKPLRGVSFIDVIVGTALILIIFLALFGVLRVTLQVSALAKAEAAATSLAQSKVEFIRSLDYDAVGTLGGIPPGTIAQTATSTLDGIAFTTRTYIQYEDDAKDGVGLADSNGITTDYKRVKISVSYSVGGKDKEVSLVTNVVPPGLETTTGGGTLRINVIDAGGLPVSGASVRIVNASTAPTVDVTTFSSDIGVVYLPGAATSSEYQVYVSKSGYSSAQTYTRDATNQNPNPGYLTVAKDQTTTGTFSIDVLSAVTMRTYSPIQTATTTDTFASSASLTNMAQSAVTGGALTLSGASGTYPSSGSARQVVVSPSYLYSWKSVTATRQTTASTTAKIRVLDSSGTRLPDAVLSGNSAGFTAFPVSLSGVSTTTYSSLMLEADLGSVDAMYTPQVLDWSLSYETGPTPLPNIPFTLTGAKTKGTTGAGAPIIKNTIATTTDSTGVRALSLEWDIYTLTISGYDVTDSCSPPPYTIAPGITDTYSLYMVPSGVVGQVLVSVKDATGAVVSGATVQLTKSGYSSTVTTNTCGTGHFGNLSSGTYTITISKTGYTTAVYTGVSVTTGTTTFYATSFE
ncbi:MAG: carboxypeptidase regulatory-like domain-containing protein [Candidatus Pacebacteria bacterium]|nr:carboxypeptidase regulatory-like domain-containing protein [Candidatus Paceibacterota bacterium]